MTVVSPSANCESGGGVHVTVTSGSAVSMAVGMVYDTEVPVANTASAVITEGTD